MSDVEDGSDQGSPNGKKVGKKKHYPFGTSDSAHAYSAFAHISNPQTQHFATLLAAGGDTKIEPEIVEDKPKRKPRAAPKASIGGKSDPVVENPADSIPDAEGLEPCTKIGCQEVLRTMKDLVYKNEVERDDIEDEYERLLQELAYNEQEVAVAEQKLVTLNEIGAQLEVRHDALMEKVEELEETKDVQNTERNDVNNKLMVLQTEKNKRLRLLDKAQKTLADAMWRKKKQEHLDQVADGSVVGSSEIEQQHIKQADAETVNSMGSLYKTAYNQLAAEAVRDHIEHPQPVKVLPPYLLETLADATHYGHMDKYAQKHYKTLQDSALKSWSHMEGTLLTASVNSAGSTGYGPEVTAKSYEQYNQVRKAVSHAPHTPIGGTSAALRRVGSLLRSRSNLLDEHGSISLPSPTSRSATGIAAVGRGRSGSRSVRSNSLSRSHSQVKLAPLDGGPVSRSHAASAGTAGTGTAGAAASRASSSRKVSAGAAGPPAAQEGTGTAMATSVSGGTVGEAPSAAVLGLGGALDTQDDNASAALMHDGDGNPLPFNASASQVSLLSVDSQLMGMPFGGGGGGGSFSTFSPMGEGDQFSAYTVDPKRLDPVFFKNQSRSQWGRSHKVGKMRKSDVKWGMKGYKDPNQQEGIDDDSDAESAKSPNVKGNRRMSTAAARDKALKEAAKKDRTDGKNTIINGLSSEYAFFSRCVACR
mmetsp:Transcript_22690/g.37861  ORF Transcript_22690/g.37861 Transcript_22690/m.37861 type:complete len:702 (+) Transcript_22690:83-2188(+)